MGPIEPPSPRGHRFILAATDYFSRWTEAISLKEVKEENVIKFFKDHVLYKFGTPEGLFLTMGGHSEVSRLEDLLNITK